MRASLRFVVIGFDFDFDLTKVFAGGKEFFPVGFETSGASTSHSCSLIKKLSEIGQQRRGHHAAYFVLRWRATLAMTLAKKGCEVALQRAFVVR